ncbi:hypothetical protein [Olleya sp. R77988]|uniref:hypothetical protein n=1 Tax=Olleya sp. R77988 TaxID=3093875 RepID=UPI0037C897D8
MKLQYKILSILILLLSFSNGLNAQEKLNDYKYLVVTEQFTCQKEANLYRLNGLSKFLLQKQNFNVLLDSEVLPDELVKNNCLALYVDVIENNNMFTTKLNVVFKDCRNQVVFTSDEGTSKEKKFEVSFNKALRNAFKTFENFKYNYQEKSPEISVTVKEEPEPIVVKQIKEKPEPIKTEVSETIRTENTVLYAQPTANGFQLVDQTPKVVYKIKTTNLKNVFLVEGQEAIIYKLDANWILEFYKEGKLQKEILNIKF